MVISKGKIITIDSWNALPDDIGSVSFPNLTFLKLLFSYRKFEELEQSYADCWYKNYEALVVLNQIY